MIWQRVVARRRAKKARFVAAVRAGKHPSLRIGTVGGEQVLLRIQQNADSNYREGSIQEEIVKRLEQRR
jgi:hypothetical protein